MARTPKSTAQADVYECVSPIDHDGKRISVGDVVEMPADIAQRLVAGGALVPVSAPQPASEQ